jgi:hypothetical protein
MDWFVGWLYSKPTRGQFLVLEKIREQFLNSSHGLFIKDSQTINIFVKSETCIRLALFIKVVRKPKAYVAI